MKFAALGLAVAVLGGCATAPVQVTNDTHCRIDRPLKWSVRDTRETISEIRRHNARFRGVCR